MTRLEKCQLLKKKGYTYDKDTGKVYGVRGQEIKAIRNGYILLQNHKPDFPLHAHHYAWYYVYGNVDFKMLDHINRDKTDNRICNLRISNHQQNGFNRNDKGYYFNKQINKWKTQIILNGKSIYLGSFNTEEEARQAYLKGKKKYHTL